MLGQLSKEAIATQFQQASFLVFPSEHESFGLVIAEAMATGLPVIVGNKTAPKEYVDQDCGLLVPAQDIGEIAQAMESMMSRWRLYPPEEIRQRVVERFSLKLFGERLANIYKEVI